MSLMVGEPAFGYIEGDFLLCAALKELLDMSGGIIVIHDNVVHNASVPWDPIKGFIHASVIMLRD